MLNDVKKHCNFTAWVIKYGTSSINGRTYKKGSFGTAHGMIVRMHDRTNPDAVLGYALLENRYEGIYAYCKLTDMHLFKNEVETLINTKGSVALSPFITQVKFDDEYIVGGIIREVSLVLARIDPDEAYYPVPTKGVPDGKVKELAPEDI